MAMKFKGFLLVLAAFNLYILCYYFAHFPSTNEKYPHNTSMGWIKELPRAENGGHKGSSFDGKPWPDLPSYMPWHNPVKAKAGSCEAYFGNGFNRIYRLLNSNPKRDINLSGGGSFNCFYSETLDTSICEGKKMAMFPERIEMSKGGEDVEAVLGRQEEAELPKYSEGAFQIEAPFDHITGDGRVVSDELLNQIIPQGAVHTHTMRSLLQALRLVPSADFVCDQSPMDDAWEALFTSVTYAKNFSGSVCFHHALLTPLGYETALFKGLTESIPCYGCSIRELKQKPDDRKTARLVEYGEMFRAAFGLLSGESENFRSTSVHNVLFLRREHYLAHPRHGGKVESRLSNEEEVLDALQKWARSYLKCKVKIVNGLFAHMAMKDQVQAVQEASVIVSAHGAALTHIISARPGTVVLEIISSFYRRPHFALISQWTGLEYHAINLEGSVAKTPEVVEVLSGIMKSLLC